MAETHRGAVNFFLTTTTGAAGSHTAEGVDSNDLFGLFNPILSLFSPFFSKKVYHHHGENNTDASSFWLDGSLFKWITAILVVLVIEVVGLFVFLLGRYLHRRFFCGVSSSAVSSMMAQTAAQEAGKKNSGDVCQGQEDGEDAEVKKKKSKEGERRSAVSPAPTSSTTTTTTPSSAVTAVMHATLPLSCGQEEVSCPLAVCRKKDEYAPSSSAGKGSDGRQSSQGVQSDCSTFEFLPNDLGSSSSAYSPSSPFLLEDLDSDQHTAPSGHSGGEEDDELLLLSSSSSTASRVLLLPSSSSSSCSSSLDEGRGGGGGSAQMAGMKDKELSIPTSPTAMITTTSVATTNPCFTTSLLAVAPSASPSSSSSPGRPLADSLASKDDQAVRVLLPEQVAVGGVEGAGFPTVIDAGCGKKGEVREEASGEEEKKGELSVQMTRVESMAAVGGAGAVAGMAGFSSDGGGHGQTATLVRPTAKQGDDERDTEEREKKSSSGRDAPVEKVRRVEEDGAKGKTAGDPASGSCVPPSREENERIGGGEKGGIEELSCLSKAGSVEDDEGVWKGVGVKDDEATTKRCKEQCTYTRLVMLQHFVIIASKTKEEEEARADGSEDSGEQRQSSSSSVKRGVGKEGEGGRSRCSGADALAVSDEGGEEENDRRAEEAEEEEEEKSLDYLALLRGLKAVEGRVNQTKQRPSLHHQSSSFSGGLGGDECESTGTPARRFSSRYSSITSSQGSHHGGSPPSANQVAGFGPKGLGLGGGHGGEGRAAASGGFTFYHRGSSTTTALSSQTSLDSEDIFQQYRTAGPGGGGVRRSLLSAGGGGAGGGAGGGGGGHVGSEQEEEQAAPEDLVLSEELLLSLNLRQPQQRGGGAGGGNGGRRDEDLTIRNNLFGIGIRRMADGSASHGEDEGSCSGRAEAAKRTLLSGSSSSSLSLSGKTPGKDVAVDDERDSKEEKDWRNIRGGSGSLALSLQQHPSEETSTTSRALAGGGGGEKGKKAREEGQETKEEEDNTHTKQKNSQSSWDSVSSQSKILNADAHHVLQRALKFRQLDIAMTVYDNLKRANIQIDRRNYTLLVQIGMSRKDVPVQSRWLLEMIDEGHAVDAKWLDRLLAAAAVCDPAATAELNGELQSRSSVLSPECLKVLERAAGCYISRGLSLQRRSSCSLRSSSSGTQKSTGGEEKTAEKPRGELSSSLSAPWSAKGTEGDGLKEMITGSQKAGGGGQSGLEPDPPASPSLNPHAPEFVPLNFLRPQQHTPSPSAPLHHQLPPQGSGALDPPHDLFFSSSCPAPLPSLVEAVALSLSAANMTAAAAESGGTAEGARVNPLAGRTGGGPVLGGGGDETLLFSVKRPPPATAPPAALSSSLIVGGVGGHTCTSSSLCRDPCSPSTRLVHSLPSYQEDVAAAADPHRTQKGETGDEKLSIAPVTALHFLQQQNHTDSVTSSLLAMLSNSSPPLASGPTGVLDAMMLPSRAVGGAGVVGDDSLRRSAAKAEGGGGGLSSSAAVLFQKALTSDLPLSSLSPSVTSTRLMTSPSGAGSGGDERVGGGFVGSSLSSSSGGLSSPHHSSRGGAMASRRGGGGVVGVTSQHRKEYQSILASTASSGASSSIYQTHNLRLQMQEMIAKAKNKTTDDIIRGMVESERRGGNEKGDFPQRHEEENGENKGGSEGERKKSGGGAGNNVSGGGGEKHHRGSGPGKGKMPTHLHEEVSKETQSEDMAKDGEKSKYRKGTVVSSSAEDFPSRKKPFAPSPFSSNKNTRYVREHSTKKPTELSSSTSLPSSSPTAILKEKAERVSAASSPSTANGGDGHLHHGGSGFAFRKKGRGGGGGGSSRSGGGGGGGAVTGGGRGGFAGHGGGGARACLH